MIFLTYYSESSIDGFSIRKTRLSSPETYDVYLDDNRVGYIRYSYVPACSLDCPCIGDCCGYGLIRAWSSGNDHEILSKSVEPIPSIEFNEGKKYLQQAVKEIANCFDLRSECHEGVVNQIFCEDYYRMKIQILKQLLSLGWTSGNEFDFCVTTFICNKTIETLGSGRVAMVYLSQLKSDPSTDTKYASLTIGTDALNSWHLETVQASISSKMSCDDISDSVSLFVKSANEKMDGFTERILFLQRNAARASIQR